MKKIVLATTSSQVSPREKRNGRIARNIAGEGIVLLQNKGMLPLKGKKIALYGSGARQTVAGGTGSGATHPRHCVGIEEGFLNAKFDIVSKDWLDRYDAFYEDSYNKWKENIESKIVGFTNLYQILGVISQDRFVYPTGIAVEDKDIIDGVDNAVYVIARQAGEGADRKIAKADYLLDDLECANLKKVCAAYKNVCVVINVGGFIDLSFLDELNVNAVIYYSQAGQSGGDALVDILSGKAAPSGKLTATWAKDIYDFPSTSEFSHLGDPKVQNYKEGIFVGYRYFDTFKIKPRFAFGFGLTYTSFEISSEVRLVASRVIVKCGVFNVGKFPGKEVVQVYASIPERNAEAKRLVAFGKTDVIGLDGHQHITLSFPLRDLCYYDEKRAAYILAPGNYIIRVGNSSDNTQAAAVVVNETEVVMEQCVNVCPRRESFPELQAPEKEDEDISLLPRIAVSAADITVKVNEYNELPVSTDNEIREFLDKLTNEELATLVVGGGVSASEGERIVNVMGASGTSTSELYQKYGIPNAVFSDGPAGLNITPRVVELPDGTLKSADTYPQYDFGVFGQYMRSKMIAKPEDGVCHYQYATAWPAGVVRAQTWNTELMEEFGDALGCEMEEFGVTCWLAPGMNITRNTLCGRTFEYCSEDPLLSGEIAAATVNGIQKHKGKGVSVKHFACNNSEFERVHSTSNVGERALREIYLKGFEIVVKKSNPMTVMASYNKINGVYNTNNYDLLVKVLRNEWGFENAVISDWDSVSDDTGDIRKTSHAQCDLVMPGSKKQIQTLASAISDGTVNKEELLRCAERIIKILRKNTVVPLKL